VKHRKKTHFQVSIFLKLEMQLMPNFHDLFSMVRSIHIESEKWHGQTFKQILTSKDELQFTGLSHFINCCKTSRFTHFQKSISSKLYMRFAWKFLYLLPIILYVRIMRTSCWKSIVTRILTFKNELPFTLTNFREFSKVWLLIEGPSSKRLILFKNQSTRILDESGYV
jgi:hypothetical protein